MNLNSAQKLIFRVIITGKKDTIVHVHETVDGAAKTW